MVAEFSHIQHIYQRAAFGAHPEWVRQREGWEVSEVVDELFRDSARFVPLKGIKDPTRGKPNKKVSYFKLGLLFIKSRKHLRTLNLSWIERMAKDKAQLREKMTLFWHDHFATHVPLAYLMKVQNNTIRKHALGKFGQLVHAISTDPAMLIYLNNQQNKKDAPNENFARELMELFMLGEGNYTEKDIKEAARAFTGWTVNRSGRYEFVAKEHDDGTKSFMGQEGNFNGDDIINILLKKKEVAYFLTRKIYAYFVNEQLNETHIASLAEDFYSSQFDISRLMRNILTADWFYTSENVACLIKSPVELIVGYKRVLGMEFKLKRVLLLGQDALGQVLFFPPNVAGWPTGKDWIDSSSLLFRMRMPLMIMGIDEFDIEINPQYESMGVQGEPEKLPAIFKARLNWGPLLRMFKHTPREVLASHILDALITGPKDFIDRKMLESFADRSSQEEMIKTLIIRTLALPEYQLA